MKNIKLILVSAITITLLASCGMNNQNNSASNATASPNILNEAKNGADNAVNKTGNAADDIGDTAGNIVRDAGDAVGDIADGAGNIADDAIKGAGDAVGVGDANKNNK